MAAPREARFGTLARLPLQPGNFFAAAGRKRRRRRDREERCKCVLDVHFSFVCVSCLKSLFPSGCCVSLFRELADDARGLVAKANKKEGREPRDACDVLTPNL